MRHQYRLSRLAVVLSLALSIVGAFFYPAQTQALDMPAMSAHLKMDSLPPIIDSTGNYNPSPNTASPSAPDVILGIFGNAFQYKSILHTGEPNRNTFLFLNSPIIKPLWSPASSPRTITTWVRPDRAGLTPTSALPEFSFAGLNHSSGTGFFGLIHANISGEDKIWGLNCENPTCNIGAPVVGANYTVGDWMHIALVYNGNDLLLYQDGLLIDSSLGIGTIAADSNIFTIGRPSNGPNEYSDVSLDDFRVYGTALTSQQINFVLNGCDLETPNEDVCQNTGIPITANVPQDLTFNISSNLCDLGSLSVSSASSCTHTMSASTNATNGYVINYLPTSTLTSIGLDEIDATGAAGSVSNIGTKQFGFNLVSNSSPAVGANPSGGIGAALADYNTTNIFSFNTSGATVADSSGPSELTTYTASYIANIDGDTPAGDYSTVVTYVVTASY